MSADGKSLFLFAPVFLAVALASQRRFHPALLTRFHIVGVPLDILDDIFLLHFPFEAAQCAFQRFAVLNDDFCQARFTPFLS